MKNHRLLWSAFFALMGVSIQAQDDLYYNPLTDAPRPRTVAAQPPAQEYIEEAPPPQTDYYENDYAYEYSSRIRRFHRPPTVIDYYDPLFVDQYFYDPFYLPGASIYTYGGFYNPWAWSPYYRPYFWGPPPPVWGWGPTFGVSINIGWGWSPWNNWNVYNNYFYDPYWAWNGFNPYYCPGNVWVNNYYIYNNGVNGNPGFAPQTYTYGPRSGGVKTSNNSYTALSTDGKRGRLVDTRTEGPVVELNNPQNGGVQKSRMPSSELPNAQPTQQTGKPARTTPADLQREQPAEQTSKPARTTPADLQREQPAEQTSKPARTTPAEFQREQPTQQTSKPARTEPINREGAQPAEQTTRPARTAPSGTTRTEPAEQSTRSAPSGAQPQRSQPGNEVSPTRRQQPAAQERSEGSRPSDTYDRPNRSKSDPRSYQPANRNSEPSRSYDRPSSSNRSSSPSSGGSSRSSGGSKPSSGGSGKSSGGGGSKGRN